MVRLGPSASNKQPWRIVRDGATWHVYIQRTPGYRNRWIVRLMNVDDLQRVDAGIAMCHFERTARELGLDGRWIVSEPPIQKPDGMTEYVTSWEEG
jgi:nitroreductase